MAETHLINVHESLVAHVDITVLSNRQFCIVLDPYIEGKQHIGAQQLRQGERKFFLQPGESLRDGIEEIYVLGEDEALLMRCDHEFVDSTPANLLSADHVPQPLPDEGRRRAGETWMIYGPCEYTPPVEVSILEKREAIPLDENEGIYVRLLPLVVSATHFLARSIVDVCKRAPRYEIIPQDLFAWRLARLTC